MMAKDVRRTKYTIGGHSRDGAPSESIRDWLRHGRISLTRTRSIAGSWKAARRAGHDPVAEWDVLLSQEREATTAKLAATDTEAALPTVKEAVESFMAKIMAGKSTPAVRYRLHRLAAIIGDKKIPDVTRQDVIAALDTIAAGRADGKATDRRVLTQAKRLWRSPNRENG